MIKFIKKMLSPNYKPTIINAYVDNFCYSPLPLDENERKIFEVNSLMKEREAPIQERNKILESWYKLHFSYYRKNLHLIEVKLDDLDTRIYAILTNDKKLLDYYGYKMEAGRKE